MFPSSATASLTGIGSFFGSLGDILLSLFVQKKMFVYYESIGQIREGYFIMFYFCGCTYLLAWFIMNLLSPEMKPVEK